MQATLSGNTQTGQDVVIHIGWHKSASTFLQNGYFQQLGANYQPLAAFPPGFDAARSRFGSLIDLVEAREGFDPALLQSALAPRDGAAGTTILSHEEISGHPHGYALIDAFASARNLAAAYPSARIVAIVRNQFDYILSLYSYRVAVRGHESRGLDRFMDEEIRDGLARHVQYDRLVAEYVRLFGADKVLVLPMEMLRTDAEGFFRRLSGFIGLAPRAAPDARSANESTRQALALAIWRPVNALFGLLLGLLLRLKGLRPADYDSRKVKVYPFLKLRYRFYAFKRAATARLNRLFPRARRIGPQDIARRGELEGLFAASNDRLRALGVVDWDMAAHGYLVGDARTGSPSGRSHP